MTISRATLIEVAREANTSKTSVSRFFGPERDKLSPALKARIDTAARTLGYQPNLMARGLKGGGTQLLGMLVADIRNPFSVAAVHAVEQAARARGYSLIVCNTGNDPSQEQRHLALLTAYQVEGLVVNAVGAPHQALDSLTHTGVPVVLLDREIPSVSRAVVGLDNALAIDTALDHLVARGYRQVLYVTNDPATASARRERLERFIDQSAARQLTAHVQSSLDPASLYPALEALKTPSFHAPVAVLCANGTATLSVVQGFQAQGLTLGAVGLMGIDELDWCALVGPGVTTLAQPFDAIGEAAIARLLDPPDTRITDRHAPHLLARGSTIHPDFPLI
ncbi:substrate-binding domain-containing protein [Halomonas sp. PAMB 3232]|uniref:LacI family DNA-binding transcriptional regulator n=1 Tax=Halomonas sp. PAMB 3232 TaxID=3075221 RepID=UPI00289A55CD|nr:substrate-binding domain-containing protein [Halomonas sp. PAMB 3232]WNL40227.1 substrate-binding domain-containing protein [Halomonas sp. PAMB 3232]